MTPSHHSHTNNISEIDLFFKVKCSNNTDKQDAWMLRIEPVGPKFFRFTSMRRRSPSLSSDLFRGDKKGPDADWIKMIKVLILQ